MKARELVAVVAAMVVLGAVTLAHTRHGGTGSSVQGLHGMFVSVHIDGKSLTAAGLTNPQVWSAVVLRLRLAGLKVLNEEERQKTPGKPYLYVSLSDTLLSKQAEHPAGYVCTCSFDLMQEVTLARPPQFPVEACTWSRGATLIVPPNDTAEVRIVVDNLAKEFADAVAEANNHVAGGAPGTDPLEKQ